jgi:hypothetical protein
MQASSQSNRCHQCCLDAPQVALVCFVMVPARGHPGEMCTAVTANMAGRHSSALLSNPDEVCTSNYLSYNPSDALLFYCLVDICRPFSTCRETQMRCTHQPCTLSFF